MSGPRRYGAGFVAWMVLLVVAGVGAVAMLIRGGPTLEFDVFGVAAAGERARGSEGVRGRPGVRTVALAAAPRVAAPVPEPALPVPAFGLPAPPPPPGPLDAARRAAWEGDPAAGAAALERLAAGRPDDAALLAEAARLRWWAGEADRADSLASAALRADPSHAGAAALRREIRAAGPPTAAMARRWVRERDGAEERLHLARALVAEGRAEAALPHFRAAVARGAPATARRELASAALAAGRPAEAADALEAYVAGGAGARADRVALARARLWAEEYDRAVPAYRALLEEADEAPLRLELAQALAWSGREAEAAEHARRAAGADPSLAEAVRLAAELEGRAAEAERARRAALPPPAAVARVEAESFGDSEGFRWTTLRAVRPWEGAGWRGEAAALREEGSGTGAWGVEASAGRALGAGVRATARLGARAYDGGAVRETVGASVEAAAAGGTVSLEAVRQPAARRAGTLAALEAGVRSELLAVTASLPAGEWHLWGRAEAERLRSGLGTTPRLAASASASRALTGRVSVAAGVSALATGGDAPRAPGGLPLYWAPAAYLAPSVTLRYRAAAGRGWTVGAGASPGVALVRERAGDAGRFTDGVNPTLSGELDAAYRRGGWSVGAAAAWGGALEGGYRSATLRLGGAYAPGGR